MQPDPAAPGSNHSSEVIWGKIIDVAELIDCSALLGVKGDSAKSLIVDRTHPVPVSGKLVPQKNMPKIRRSLQKIFYGR